MAWSAWLPLGAPPGGLAEDPAVVSRADDHISIYARGRDNRLWQRAYWPGGGADWFPFDDGFLLGSAPAAGTLGPTHEHIYAIGPDSQIWQRWWSSGWSPWQPIGRPPVPILGPVGPVERPQAGRAAVYVTSNEGQMWSLHLANNAWSAWTPHDDGRLSAVPSAVRVSSTEEWILARGSDGLIYQRSKDDARGLSPWASLGAPPTGAIGPARAAFDSPQFGLIAVTGGDSLTYIKAYAGSFSDWVPIDGQMIGSPGLARVGPGRFVLVSRSADGMAWMRLHRVEAHTALTGRFNPVSIPAPPPPPPQSVAPASRPSFAPRASIPAQPPPPPRPSLPVRVTLEPQMLGSSDLIARVSYSPPRTPSETDFPIIESSRPVAPPPPTPPKSDPPPTPSYAPVTRSPLDVVARDAAHLVGVACRFQAVVDVIDTHTHALDHRALPRAQISPTVLLAFQTSSGPGRGTATTRPMFASPIHTPVSAAIPADIDAIESVVHALEALCPLFEHVELTIEGHAHPLRFEWLAPSDFFKSQRSAAIAERPDRLQHTGPVTYAPKPIALDDLMSRVRTRSHVRRTPEALAAALAALKPSFERFELLAGAFGGHVHGLHIGWLQANQLSMDAPVTLATVSAHPADSQTGTIGESDPD